MSRLISRCSVSPETSSAMEGQLFPEYQYDTRREIEPAFFCFPSPEPPSDPRKRQSPSTPEIPGRARSSSPSARALITPSARQAPCNSAHPGRYHPLWEVGTLGLAPRALVGRRGRGRVASVRRVAPRPPTNTAWRQSAGSECPLLQVPSPQPSSSAVSSPEGAPSYPDPGRFDQPSSETSLRMAAPLLFHQWGPSPQHRTGAWKGLQTLVWPEGS